MIYFNLEKIIKEKNINIQDIADSTGLSRNTISQILNNKAKGIQFPTLEKLLDYLEVEVQKLIVYEREFSGELMEFFDVTSHHEYKIEEGFSGSHDMHDAIEMVYINTDFLISYKYRRENFSITGTFPLSVEYYVTPDKGIQSIHLNTNNDYDDEFKKIISAATDYYKIEKLLQNFICKKGIENLGEYITHIDSKFEV